MMPVSMLSPVVLGVSELLGLQEWAEKRINCPHVASIRRSKAPPIIEIVYTSGDVISREIIEWPDRFMFMVTRKNEPWRRYVYFSQGSLPRRSKISAYDLLRRTRRFRPLFIRKRPTI